MYSFHPLRRDPSGCRDHASWVLRPEEGWECGIELRRQTLRSLFVKQMRPSFPSFEDDQALAWCTEHGVPTP
jgi:hypothetical protein